MTFARFIHLTTETIAAFILFLAGPAFLYIVVNA